MLRVDLHLEDCTSGQAVKMLFNLEQVPSVFSSCKSYSLAASKLLAMQKIFYNNHESGLGSRTWTPYFLLVIFCCKQLFPCVGHQFLNLQQCFRKALFLILIYDESMMHDFQSLNDTVRSDSIILFSRLARIPTSPYRVVGWSNSDLVSGNSGMSGDRTKAWLFDLPNSMSKNIRFVILGFLRGTFFC